MARKIIKHLQSLLASEQGAVVREWGHRRSVALVYPQEYAVGMSNLGFQTVYHLLNAHPDLACERVFLPAEAELQEYQRSRTPLLSLESQRPLTDFAAVAFSLSFEPDYLNVLNILELARIPLLAAHRGDQFPPIVAGGAAAMLNPEPLTPFLDAFFLGEGEAAAALFFEILTGHPDRQTAFKTLAADVPGVYIPSAYQPDYHADGTLRRFTVSPGYPAKIRVPHLTDLNSYPVHSRLLAPGSEFSRMFLVEVNRGCGRGCRFCAAGFIYRPPRHRSVASLQAQLQEGLATGAKIGFIGTAAADHPDIRQLLRTVTASGGQVGMSSLRADCADAELLTLLHQGGVKSVALAPEAGSERLRRVINKGLTETDLQEAVVNLHAAGLSHLRLYFMVGLPTETHQDVEDIARLTKRLQHAVVKASAGRSRPSITLSLNSFVPKPFTPFQWTPFAGVSALKERLRMVKRELQGQRQIRVHADLPKWAYFQALLARGDRRVGSLLLDTHQASGDWSRACRQSPVNPDFFVLRERSRDELLPWDFIDHGIDKSYLWEEYQNALAERETPPCQPDVCSRCGVCPGPGNGD
ncbi:MAG: radical SAM protein [Deltaproteobacteria bacterium]|nr:radical SAM protein [Deltaproteobacteria bacterium]